jgi:hypothetical protein
MARMEIKHNYINSYCFIYKIISNMAKYILGGFPVKVIFLVLFLSFLAVANAFAVYLWMSVAIG